MASLDKRRWTGKLGAAAILLLFGARSASAYDWLQFGGDPQHSSRNTAETVLTPANIGALALRYQATLPATVDGAPVFLESVATTGGVKDLLFVTTTDGRIVAVDAQNGSVVWNHQNGSLSCTINNGGSACYTTSSPAIDPNRLFVYSYGLEGYVHKYQVGDGNEILTGGWPQLATLKGYDEKGSSALAIATSGGVKYLYAAHAGYPGDQGDYQGHVTAINLASGAQKVFNTACSDKAVHLDHFTGSVQPTTCASVQDAIWARPGVFYDAGTDRIFVATGNAFTAGVGRFDGIHNWSESVLALHPDGTGAGGKPLDSYTPPNWSSLDDSDADIGSTGPTILSAPPTSTVQHLALQSGKDGMLRLLNLSNLSSVGGPGHVGGSVGAPFAVPQGGGVFQQPATWINPADGSNWVFVVNGRGASALRLAVDGGGNPSLVTQWNQSIDSLGASLAGTSPVVANNMLFYINGSSVRVLDPVSGNSLRTASGTGSPHWQSLIVANGVVYVTDQASHLTAFSLPSGLPPTTTVLTSGQNPGTAGSSVSLTATVTGAGPTGNVNFSEGGAALAGCASMPLSGGGSATCAISSLSVGSHAIVASYGGDAGNAGSTSGSLLQVINTASGGINVAAATAGGVASASSVFSSQFPIAALNNNERKGAGWGSGGGWNDGTANTFPDWVEIDFNGNKIIDRVIVYTLQDNYPNSIEPTDSLTFSQYGVTDFTVQGWNGAAWVTLGSVSGNNLVKRAVTFPAFTTTRIRVNVTSALMQYSRLVEVEAWGSAGPPPSSTTLASSLNPSTLGTPVTFTATVTGTAPTGSVAFTDGGNAIGGCSAVALTGSGNTRTAPCTSSALSQGTHTIVAAYTGDAGNAASSSAALSQGVNGAGSSNVALASNGGVATASTTISAAFPVSAVNNNERAGLNWGSGGGWNDATANTFPDTVSITFNGSKTINRVVVYTLQDNYTAPVEPTDTLTFTLYGVTAFTVQGKQGSKWITLASVSGNNLVKRSVTFAPFTTSQIRIRVSAALASFSRITEIEAWGN